MSEREPATSRKHSIPDSLAETLKWILTSAGLSGVFLALGFVSKSAYQERLGYRLTGHEDLPALSIEAGRFILDSLLICLNALVDHYLIVAGILFSVLVCVVFRSRLASIRIGNIGTGHLAVTAFVIVLELSVFDLPAVQLRGVLVNPVSPPALTDLDNPIYRMTRRVWLDEICSRLESEEKRDYLESQSDLRCSDSTQAHARHIYDAFALNVILTIGLAILALQSLAVFSPANWFALALKGVLVVLVVLNLMMLPFTYAKTARATLASRVTIFQEQSSESPRQGFLLHEYDDEMILYNSEETEYILAIMVPRDQIRQIAFEPQVDVVAVAISSRLEKMRIKP